MLNFSYRTVSTNKTSYLLPAKLAKKNILFNAIGASFAVKQDWDDSDVTPSINIQRDVSDAIMMYASYSEGIKSDGFDSEEADQFAADFAGSLELEYATNISDDLELTMLLGVNFSDSYLTALDQGPNTEQGAYEKVHARVELASLDSGWSIALIGKNLTDEKTTTWVNDHPVFNGGAYFASIAPPMFHRRSSEISILAGSGILEILIANLASMQRCMLADI